MSRGRIGALSVPSLCSPGGRLSAGPGGPGRAAGERPGARPEAGPLKAGTDDDPRGLGGLVPCAITPRDHDAGPAEGVLGVWRPSFPSRELVEAAAGLLPSITPVGGRGAVVGEGPRWEVVVSPGVIRVRTRDYARAERAGERARHRERVRAEVAASWLAEGKEPPKPAKRGRVTGWSRKSRARLVARLSDLDYNLLYGRYHLCTICKGAYDPEWGCCPSCGSSDAVLVDRSNRLPAMITLTYPGDWVTVAPCGCVVKAHLAALRQRYARAWGEPMICPWKLEFQSRGAPHVHASTSAPMGVTTIKDPDSGELAEVDFRRWLSITWAQIVQHPDREEFRRHQAAGTRVDYAEGIRMSDPRRMAIYFAKYGTSGSKEYQHRVPPEWQVSALACMACGHVRAAGEASCPGCGSGEGIEHECGPGRFWGYWGLHPILSIRHVSVGVGIAAGRLLRRWHHARGHTRAVTVRRVDQATGRVHYRRSHTRKRLLTNNRGFVIVRDGPSMTGQVARYLTTAVAV